MPPRPTAPDIARPMEALRRPSELTGMPPAPPPPVRNEAELRQLIVGREINLQGEIKTCDLLLVEGSVEASLGGCREVTIAETGLFRGDAVADNIEVKGRFEGTLTVHNRLYIRATGSVTGKVTYGQIEIECGGKIVGEIGSQPAPVSEQHEVKRERGPQGVIDMAPGRLA